MADVAQGASSLAAAAAVLAYIEVRVTRAIDRQTYLLEQRHGDRRRRPARPGDPARRRTDQDPLGGEEPFEWPGGGERMPWRHGR